MGKKVRIKKLNGDILEVDGVENIHLTGLGFDIFEGDVFVWADECKFIDIFLMDNYLEYINRFMLSEEGNLEFKDKYYCDPILQEKVNVKSSSSKSTEDKIEDFRNFCVFLGNVYFEKWEVIEDNLKGLSVS